MTLLSRLYEFQKLDVDKLSEVTASLIGNEMGTGKTVEGIALDEVYRAKGKGPTLVIAPKAVRPSWLSHYTKFTPHLKVKMLDASSKKAREQSLSDFISSKSDVFIVHWDVLRLLPGLQKVRWNTIIADECHRAQNRDSQQTKALKKIKSNFKIGLSGTPVTNTPDKLWSILNWLYPKDFSSYWRFFGRYVEFELQYANGIGYKRPTGPKNVEELHNRLRPYYVRHLKRGQCCELHPNGVLPDLPDKYYSLFEVDLLPQQRKAYEQMREDMIAWVGENENKPLVAPVVIAQLTRLQQFALGYATFVDGKVVLTDPSSKIDAVMQLIEDNPDKQMVVYSQFSQAVEMLNRRLDDSGISYGTIHGGVSDKLREDYIRTFQEGKLQLFTGTIKAGGVGIELFSASTIVFLDRSWSPAENLQTEDRLWRNGQKNAVQVIDIVARDTVDRARMQQIDDKWDNIKLLLGDK